MTKEELKAKQDQALAELIEASRARKAVQERAKQLVRAANYRFDAAQADFIKASQAVAAAEDDGEG